MNKQDLYHIFRALMDVEKSTQRRYAEAILLTEGRPELSKIFVEILREEQRHEKRLVFLYQKHQREFEGQSVRSERLHPTGP